MSSIGKELFLFFPNINGVDQLAFVLFDLILYVPTTIFLLNRDGSSTKLR